MSIIVKIQIADDRLALAPTYQTLSGVQIQVITQGNTDPGSTVFPFLIEYDDRDRLEATLGDDPTVKAYELVDWNDRAGIYYIEHTPETKLISTVVTDVNGFLVHTKMRDNGWFVQMLLPDREALNTIWEYATENDISFDIIEIYGNSDSGADTSYGLTDEQRAALLLAYENGYFSEPRDISLNEAAAELGLSSTAMSGRLRRGIRNLISATIADESADDR